MDVTLEKKKRKKLKPSYTPEFRKPAVKPGEGSTRVRRCGKGTGAGRAQLHNWIQAAGTGKLNSAGERTITLDERQLSLLHAENSWLKRELAIIKMEVAYRAKEAL